MTPKSKVFLAAFSISYLLDLGTKVWVAASISYADRIEVIQGFFYLTHVRNPGAAFSLFADGPEPFRRIFFLVASALAVVLVISFYRRLAPGERFPALALGMILGGAVGNLTDRVFRAGEVVDFLHFRLWSGYTWPDFNVADSAIVVGVLLLVLELLATEGESRESGDPEGADSADDDPGEPLSPRGSTEHG